jgi:hypothetical protein
VFSEAGFVAEFDSLKRKTGGNVTRKMGEIGQIVAERIAAQGEEFFWQNLSDALELAQSRMGTEESRRTANAPVFI